MFIPGLSRNLKHKRTLTTIGIELSYNRHSKSYPILVDFQFLYVLSLLAVQSYTIKIWLIKSWTFSTLKNVVYVVSKAVVRSEIDIGCLHRHVTSAGIGRDRRRWQRFSKFFIINWSVVISSDLPRLIQISKTAATSYVIGWLGPSPITSDIGTNMNLVHKTRCCKMLSQELSWWERKVKLCAKLRFTTRALKRHISRNIVFFIIKQLFYSFI